MFLYYGRRFEHPVWPVFVQLAAGPLYGYRGEYKDKIPLNQLGVAPALIPTAGVQMGNFQAELVVLGPAAMMINLGWRM